jgi:DNA-binding NtrC family response regulator
MTDSPDLPTILVIDDNQLVRNLVITQLSRSGYRVIQAADGDEGIALYRDRHQDISLVLLDVRMPRKDGMITLADLRKINPGVRCLLMTGNENSDGIRQAEVIGVMAKPFSHSSLLLALESAGVPPGPVAPTSLE